MGETIINIGGVSVYTLGLLTSFCYLWGTYVFYKKAIEAHFENEAILDMIVLGAFWGFLGARISFVILNLPIFLGHWSRVFLLTNYPGLDRWGFFVGLILGIYWIARKQKYKLLDLLDLAVLGLLSGLSLFWAGLCLIVFRWSELVLGLVNLLALVLFWDLEKKYRLIGWYRAQKTSAKSGFVSGFGLCIVGLFYWLEMVMMRTMTGVGGIWVVMLIVLGLTIVYIRSGRVLKDDINSLKIWKKTKK